MNFIITLLILVVILGIIIFIHEFGHFIAAKRIGGYVSMAEKENKELKIKKDRVLENKSFFRKLWVLLNGILFNCILAIVLFFISGLIYGEPINEPIINSVVDGGAAQVAGIESGDRIIKVNDVKISTWDDFILEASAKKLRDNYEFVVEKKDGTTKTYNLVPAISEQDGQEVRIFGITSAGATYYKGFNHALSYAWNGFADNFMTILKIIGSLFTGDVSVKNLSGPVGIYSIIDTAKSQGFQVLIYLTAYLSINVAIINLVPIPVFDGGRVFLLFVEAITKHKASEKTEMLINYIGFGLMIILMLYVTFNDIIRLVVS